MCNDLTRQIMLHKDDAYKALTLKLTPGLRPDSVIGVRIPILRKIAKDARQEDARAFIDVLPHDYYEENNLHGFLIERIKDYDECVSRLDAFLPYVDNWATCDLCTPKALKSRPEETAVKALEWMRSQRTYTVRFGIKILMNFYLEKWYKPEYALSVAEVQSDEYYVKMMAAWYFATLLIKQWQSGIEIVRTRVSDKQTLGMTIRKALDSYRLSAEQKDIVRSLRCGK